MVITTIITKEERSKKNVDDHRMPKKERKINEKLSRGSNNNKRLLPGKIDTHHHKPQRIHHNIILFFSHIVIVEIYYPYLLIFISNVFVFHFRLKFLIHFWENRKTCTHRWQTPIIAKSNIKFLTQCLSHTEQQKSNKIRIEQKNNEVGRNDRKLKTVLFNNKICFSYRQKEIPSMTYVNVQY